FVGIVVVLFILFVVFVVVVFVVLVVVFVVFVEAVVQIGFTFRLKLHLALQRRFVARAGHLAHGLLDLTLLFFFGLLAICLGLGVDLFLADLERPDAALLEERLALLAQLRELAQRQQVLQRAEPEELEEERRRPVEQRPTNVLLLAEDLQQATLE